MKYSRSGHAMTALSEILDVQTEEPMTSPYPRDDRNADNPFAYYETVEFPAKPATTFGDVLGGHF